MSESEREKKERGKDQKRNQKKGKRDGGFKGRKGVWVLIGLHINDARCT